MKRICTLLTALMLLLSMSTAAFAETFTLHSSTSFGMTIDEVLKLEKAQGFDLQLYGSETENFTCQSNLPMLYDSTHNQFYYGKGTLVNHPDSVIAYWLDDNQQVFRVQYELDMWMSGYERDMIRKALISKYGRPTYSTYNGNAISSVVNGYQITYSGWDFKTSTQEQWGSKTYTATHECRNETDDTWVVASGDTDVIVVNFSFSAGHSNYGGDTARFSFVLLTYTKVPKTDFYNSIYDWTKDI